MQTRWTPQRKLALVYNVQNDIIPFETACKLYDLSANELNEWIAGNVRVTKKKVDA